MDELALRLLKKRWLPRKDQMTRMRQRLSTDEPS
jgi:hypothetical protein